MSAVDPAETPIWLRQHQGRPGPRPRHTIDEIADVAVRIADAEGLDGLSMRSVADALGTGPASLYRYVASKTDLTDLMADHVAGEYTYPALIGDAHDDVLAILDQIRASRRRHPWLADVRAPAVGPNAVRLLDHMAAALAPLGADADSTMLGIAMLSGWAMSVGSQEAVGQSLDAAAAAGAAHLQALVDAEQHPHLTALSVVEGDARTERMDVDETFRRGVESLIAGLRAHPSQ